MAFIYFDSAYVS